MANNYDTAKGSPPYEKLLASHYYAIAASTVINFMHGDLVGVSGANLLTPKMGYLPGLATAAVIDGMDNLAGSVLALFDEDMDPVKYIAATEAGNGVIAGYALVADDPHQMFVGLEDLVVVHSPEATLICHKSQAQLVKDLVTRLEQQGKKCL